MRRSIRLISCLAAAALLILAGCGGGNSSSTPPPPPTPTVHGPVIVYPGAVSIPAGAQADFSAYLPSQPSNTTFTWQVGGSTNGSISATGVYTAPTSVPSPAQVLITATGQGQTGTAVVTITSAQGLAVSPAATAVAAGTTATFSATLNGQAVTPAWQVSGSQQGADYGSINASGTYTAPIAPPPGGAATITAVSGSNSGTATVQIQSSSASLKGQYALSFSGSDSSQDSLAVAGTLTADGAGNITNGLWDVNVVSSTGTANVTPASAFTGTYTVGPDGRGTALLSTGDTLQFTVISNQHALLELFDRGSSNAAAATGSGTLDIQKPADFSLNSIANHYAIQASGIDSNGNSIGIVGRLFASAGTVPLTTSILDINDTGSQTLDDTDAGVSGSYTLDAGNPNSGRGTLTLSCPTCSSFFGGTSVSFAFYMVDRTHLKLIESDATGALLAGDAFSAPAPGQITALTTGGYAFTLGGATQGGPYAFGGVFTAGANDSVTGGVLDISDASQLVQQNLPFTGQGYVINASNGQIQLTLSTQNVQKKLVGYLTTSGSIDLLETDTGLFAAGAAYPQTTTATPQGTFALNLTGTAINGGNFSEQDIGGQFTTESSGALTGAVDINNAIVKNATSPNTLLVNTTLPAAGASGRGNPFTLRTTAPSATFQLSYYVVDANTALLLEVDGTRVMTGAIAKQF